MTRVFLAAVGAAYLVLAAWCALLPAQTSASVGFTLAPGSGQSEFLTVYGGLQLALGLIFLRPIFRPEQTAHTLLICLTIHACLVALRSIGFLQFSGISKLTYFFAALEWGILLASWFCYRRKA